jgi:hypothetical protein
MPSPMPQALRLDRFAELSARMASGEKKSDVLASAQVDDAHWDASQQFWLGKMAAEASRQKFALSLKYAGFYRAAMTRLTKAAAERKVARKREAPPQQVVVHAIPVAPPPPAPVVLPPSSVRPAGPPLPVSPPPSVAPPPSAAYAARLSVEQLAAMRAEVATSAETEHPGIFQRFGLDGATWELEEAHWQRRLAKDPDLFQRYLRQFQYCRSLLQRG